MSANSPAHSHSPSLPEQGAPRISVARHSRERWLAGGAALGTALVALLPAVFHERISTIVQGIQNRLSIHRAGFDTGKHPLPVQEVNGIRIESTLTLSHHADGRIMDMKMECVLSGDGQPVTICQSKINPQIILNGADDVLYAKNWTPEARATVRRALELSELDPAPQAQGNIWGIIPGATAEDKWEWARKNGLAAGRMVLQEAAADEERHTGAALNGG